VPRITEPARIENFEGEEREAFKATYRRFHSDDDFSSPLPVGTYFGVGQHSPILNNLLSEFGRRARQVGEKPGSYSHADREFVDQVLCAEMKFDAFQHAHLPDAVSLGIRVEAIEALRSGRDEDLTEDELLLATFVRGVFYGNLTDATWAAMEKRLGTRGVVDYTMFCAFLPLVIRLYQAFQIDGPDAAWVERTIAEMKAGTYEFPDWRKNMI